MSPTPSSPTPSAYAGSNSPPTRTGAHHRVSTTTTGDGSGGGMPSLLPHTGNDSDVHLPSLAQVQEEAMEDAKRRFREYHGNAGRRAAQAMAAVTAGAGGQQRSIGGGGGAGGERDGGDGDGDGGGNDGEIVDLSYSPSPPAYQPLPPDNHSPTSSIYGSPLSVTIQPYTRSSSNNADAHGDADGDGTSPISSPLHTPKGHPIESFERELADGGGGGGILSAAYGMMTNVATGQMDRERREDGTGTFGALKGFMGGGGTGVDRGMRTGAGVSKEGADKDKKWVGSYGQKIYRPKTTTHRKTSQPSTRPPTFRTTISRLARVPRKYRPAVILAVLVLAVVAWVWAVKSRGAAERLSARRQALHRQRAFVIPPSSSYTLARHPAAHLTASEVRQAQHEYHLATAEQAGLDIEEGAPGMGAVVDVEASRFEMNPREELAALFSFFTSTSANALPPLDPQEQLDPQLVLDFDYTKPSAREHMAELEREIWGMFPVVLVGKMRDPWHRELKKLLSTYKISPPPMILEIDQRSDAQHLVPLLARLLGKEGLPQVIVGGRTIGGYKDVTALLESGTLMDALSGGGAVVSEKKLKKKPKYVKDAERAESERVLGPKPIVEDDE